MEGELFCDLNCKVCDAYGGDIGCLMFNNIIPMRVAVNASLASGVPSLNVVGFWKDRIKANSEEMTPLKIPVFDFETKC